VVAMGASILLGLRLHTPLYSELFEWIPTFRYGRFPVKFLFVANLCLALLAGTGWASLQTSEDVSCSGRRQRRAVALLVALSAGLAAFYGESAWKLLGVTRTAAGEFQWSVAAEPVRIGANLILRTASRSSASRHVLALLLLRSWSTVRLNVLGVAVLLVVLLTCGAPTFGSAHQATQGCMRQLRSPDICRSERRDGLFQSTDSGLLGGGHPSIRYETDSVIWISLYRKLTLFPFLAAKDHIAYSLFPSVDRLEAPFVQQLLVSSRITVLNSVWTFCLA
jgi:hypothetical protein